MLYKSLRLLFFIFLRVCLNFARSDSKIKTGKQTKRNRKDVLIIFSYWKIKTGSKSLSKIYTQTFGLALIYKTDFRPMESTKKS